MKVTHEFDAFYNKTSEILILGSIPSPKSREEGFYYAHPQNRFWKVISEIYKEQLPETINEKKKFLLKHKIALWDVLESCDIEGASDTSIKNPKANDINKVLENTNITKIYVTGRTAEKLYNKYCYKNTKIKAVYLPSTSPVNCRSTLDDLIEKYAIIKM